MNTKPSKYSEFKPKSETVSLQIDTRSAEAAVDRAHQLFSRVLMSWASDVLELRRRSELTPIWKSGTGKAAGWSMNEAA